VGEPNPEAFTRRELVAPLIIFRYNPLALERAVCA